MFLLLGLVLVAAVLLDAFSTIVLPRSVQRKPYRIGIVVLSVGWAGFRLLARRRDGTLRQGLLAAFAPAALIVLVVVWALLLILGLALVQYGLGSPLSHTQETGRFWSYLYLSGTT